MNAIADLRPLASRCPACGQPIDSRVASRCPLCGFKLGDEQLTGADVTPYGKAYAQGEPGWWAMCRWIWSAGSGRLQHIAPMRMSAAAKRFAWINTLLLAISIAGLLATRVGWRSVGSSPDLEPSKSVKPVGRGWLHVAAAPRPLPPGQAPHIAVDLWWNPVQALIASIIAGLSVLLLIWLIILVTRSGLNIAHTTAYRGEQRMSAAFLYSTAWWIPALAGIVICFLRPLSSIGQLSAQSWYPTNRGLSLLAGTVVGLAASLWWFWLIRLGATAPAKTRGRVMAFCMLGIPLLLAGAALGWWIGLAVLHEFLTVHLNIHF